MSPFPENYFFTPESQPRNDLWRKVREIEHGVFNPLYEIVRQIDAHISFYPDPDAYGPDTDQYPSVGELISKIVTLQKYFNDIQTILRDSDSSNDTLAPLTEDLEAAKATAGKLLSDLIAADAQYQQRLNAWIQQHHPEITLDTASIEVRDAAKHAIADENIAIATEENGAHGLALLKASETWFIRGEWDVQSASKADLEKMHRLLKGLHTATREDRLALLYYPAGEDKRMPVQRGMVSIQDPNNEHNTPSARKLQRDNIIALNNAIREEEKRRYGFSTLPVLTLARTTRYIDITR